MAWWRVSGGKGPAKGTLESLSLSLGSAACAECRRLGCCTDCKGGSDQRGLRGRAGTVIEGGHVC